MTSKIACCRAWLAVLFILSSTSGCHAPRACGNPLSADDVDEHEALVDEAWRTLDGGPVVTPDDAVAVAERFVREQGYTHATAQAEPTQLQREMTDLDENDDRTLASRRGMLDPEAVAVARGRNGYIVAFAYAASHELSSSDDRREVGRAVLVTADGTNARMQHQDACLDFIAAGW